jgi:hypothetical protein
MWAYTFGGDVYTIIPRFRSEIVRQLMKFCLAILIALLTACGSTATQPYTLGEKLLDIDFSRPFDWERYVNPAQGVEFQVVDGVYQARAWDGGFTWTLHPLQTSDVVIEADVIQYSDYRDNAYGLMCRAKPQASGDGYFFMISADGMYTIRRGVQREIGALIPWTPSGAIQQDKGINRLRVVCIGDSLALYVNGQFVAETRDRRYQRGSVGITAAVPEDGDVDVRFDNLEVWAATPRSE